MSNFYPIIPVLPQAQMSQQIWCDTFCRNFHQSVFWLVIQTEHRKFIWQVLDINEITSKTFVQLSQILL